MEYLEAFWNDSLFGLWLSSGALAVYNQFQSVLED